MFAYQPDTHPRPTLRSLTGPDSCAARDAEPRFVCAHGSCQVQRVDRAQDECALDARDADHPRIDLLRHKSLTVGRMVGFEPVIHTAELVGVVRKDWRAIRPISEWIAEHAQA